MIYIYIYLYERERVGIKNIEHMEVVAIALRPWEHETTEPSSNKLCSTSMASRRVHIQFVLETCSVCK